MLIKVTIIRDGHGPSEKLIGVRTSGGEVEQVIVSKRILKGSTIEVGLGLAYEDGRILIELPRESTSGKWRVWIPESGIASESLQAAE